MQMIIDENKDVYIKELADEYSKILINEIRQKIEDQSHLIISENFDGQDEDSIETMKEFFKDYVYEFVNENL